MLSFLGLATRAHGQASLPRSAVLVDLAVALKCFGVSCSYMLVIGQLFPDACRYWGTPPLLENRIFWQSIFMVIPNIELSPPIVLISTDSIDLFVILAFSSEM